MLTNLAFELEVINKFEKFDSVEVHGKLGNVTSGYVRLFTTDWAGNTRLGKQFVCYKLFF